MIDRTVFLVLVLIVLKQGHAYAAEAEPEEDANGGTDVEREAGDGEEHSAKGDVPRTPLVDPETGVVDVARIMEHLEELYRAESTVSRVKVTVTRPRRKREMEMTITTKGSEKALAVIESPARERGMATLMVGDNLWNYLPRISRTMRLPMAMMSSPWMGTDLTNDDLVSESSLTDDYTAEFVGRNEEPDGWRIRLSAKEDTVGLWEKIEYVVTPDGRLPLRAEYYDRKGRLSRIMRFEDPKVFDGRRVQTRMVVVPQDEEDRKTELVYTDIDFGADVPDSTFSLSALERHR
jgi:outer membrane lipoprotein-sorting protein